ncbi:hypothetical protein N7516_000619 [Penicillium verrucosum]|uniref:uncharacterized protein n=1 Tax=Penicillium verrucosum TaxID=60171 RepID=UPI002544D6F2|nr:uncharacterized protein N7516_000619 [Penicillium verrucosum]KAJ5940451.1 hypothetical protein N7516_000619 [Penicillium verrucosum]
MKTIRRLPTRLVLETEAGLVLQRLWYRLGRRQDTSELEHPLRLRDAQQTERGKYRRQRTKDRDEQRTHMMALSGERDYNWWRSRLYDVVWELHGTAWIGTSLKRSYGQL